MATYQLVGSQDPANRIDRVLVEYASEDHPDGKVLELNGPPVELTDDQYYKLSGLVRLQPVKAGEVEEPQYVDQPGVERVSTSTGNPPDPGRAPDIDSLNKSQLVDELTRVRSQDPTALPDVSAASNKDELADALRKYHGQEG